MNTLTSETSNIIQKPPDIQVLLETQQAGKMLWQEFQTMVAKALSYKPPPRLDRATKERRKINTEGNSMVHVTETKWVPNAAQLAQ